MQLSSFTMNCCSPLEPKYTATKMYQPMKINSMQNGITGKRRMLFISPTANDPSSISSMAILILWNYRSLGLGEVLWIGVACGVNTPLYPIFLLYYESVLASKKILIEST